MHNSVTLCQNCLLTSQNIGSALARFDPHHAAEWAKQIKWLRLRILKSSASASEEDKAYVEFIAHYLFQGRKEKLHEISEFQYIEGRWYYVNGQRF